MGSQLLRGLRGLAGLLILTAAGAWAQAPATPAVTKLRIVGGLAGLNQFTQNEAPFWSKDLQRLSGGKYSADIVPFDKAGVPGPEMLRLMQLGVVPFGTALLSNVSAQYPEYAAPDLAGLNPDMASLKKAVSSFRPFLEKALRERHNVELLAIYTYPAQVVFCQKPITALADLAGRRVRVSSATQSDFISALGATPVLSGLAQLMPNMASGNTECAITGSMSGNTLGLHVVTSHIHSLPITWGLALFGANHSAWSALPADLRDLLEREIPKLESAVWQASERETSEGFACNRGAAACVSGRKGKMREVAMNGVDEQLRKDILIRTVLPRWIQRCNGRCVDTWNQTVGPAVGLTAPVPK